MVIRKRIPKTEEGFDLMLQSLDEKCPDYKTTLNISDAQLAMVAANAAAYHGWRLLKNQINDTKTSVTNFVKDLFLGSKKNPLPVTPDLNFVVPPVPAKPGIVKQIKDFIEYLELQDDFTDAIGLDLGFYEETSSSVSSESKTANFTVKDYLGYRLDIIFSLQGENAFRLSHRVKGTTAWTHETLTSSPYTLEVEPDPDGKAVTLEMQGVLMKNNKPVGNPSDLKTVIAHG